MSEIAKKLARQIKAAGLPEPVPEYLFHPKRNWRFDFAYPKHRIALEVEGGTWTGGRHTRGKGFADDCRKYNEAALMGWRVFRFTSDMIQAGDAVNTVAEAHHGTRLQALREAGL